MTLHPFDDGNGRVTRALADRALAQAENNPVRFYSHSAAIMAKRNEYYSLLEKTQKGTLEITGWLQWFLSTLIDAVALSRTRFEQMLYKARFWQRHAQTVLNEREIKVLNRLIDSHGEEFTDGINATKYRGLAKVSKATATRELADLVKKRMSDKAAGRRAQYTLSVDRLQRGPISKSGKVNRATNIQFCGWLTLTRIITWSDQTACHQ